MDIGVLLGGAQFLNSALDAFAKVKAHFKAPEDAKQRAEAENAINDAEEKLELAKAQVGKAFDYPLCKCNFPPVVCLKVRSDEHNRIFRCPKCGDEYPVSKGGFRTGKVIRG
jgi:hypothetical protein